MSMAHSEALSFDQLLVLVAVAESVSDAFISSASWMRSRERDRRVSLVVRPESLGASRAGEGVCPAPPWRRSVIPSAATSSAIADKDFAKTLPADEAGSAAAATLLENRTIPPNAAARPARIMTRSSRNEAARSFPPRLVPRAST